MDYLLRNYEDQIENIMDVVDCAYTYNIDVLKESLKKYFNETMDRIIHLKNEDKLNFLRSTPLAINSLYQMPLRLNISYEIDMLDILQEYVNEYEINFPDIRDKLRPAIHTIRFLALPDEDIQNTTLISEQDKTIVLAIKEQNLTTSLGILNVT